MEGSPPAPTLGRRAEWLSEELSLMGERTHERVLSKPNGMIRPPPQAVHVIGLAKNVHMPDLLLGAGEQSVGRIFK